MKANRFIPLLLLGLWGALAQGHGVAKNRDTQSAALNSLAEIEAIDAHAHVYVADAAVEHVLSELNLHLLNILVIDDRDKFFNDLEPQLSDAIAVQDDNKGRIALCTTFSPYDFKEPQFTQRVIHQLDQNFAEGAVAVKIYKTIGMEIRRADGDYLMPDDPLFDPIYDEIEARNRTVIAHIAEPNSCWRPPDPKSPDYTYYSKHPQEYAYLHPDCASKAEILRARDHLLEKHPRLRFVGAHLGSMEVDVDEIAKRFDRYSNFAVDTAARIPYLMLQPRGKVRAFLIKYQDRVLYGTDLDLQPGANVSEVMNDAKSVYLRDWKYFATIEMVRYNGKNVKGLGLPSTVLRKLYHDNAVRWIPGILTSGK